MFMMNFFETKNGYIENNLKTGNTDKLQIKSK